MDEDQRAADPDLTPSERRPSGAPEIPEILREQSHGPRPASGPRRSGGGTRAWVLATQFGYAVVGMLLIGLLLDWLFGTSPWITIIGTLLGVIVGGYQFISGAIRLGSSGGSDRPPTERGPRA